MKYFAPFFLLLCLIQSACASSRITASITVTNATTNGMTFTVGSDARTFTNNPVNPLNMVATNSDVTGCGSKTNLYQQIGLSLFSQLVPTDTGSNTFQLVGPCGYNFAVTMSAGLGTVSYSTQTCAVAIPVGIPFASYYPNPANATNVASQLALDIPSNSTNSFDQNSSLMSQVVGTNNSQTISGKKVFNNTNDVYSGWITNAPGVHGKLQYLSGGVISNATFFNGSSGIDAIGRGFFALALAIYADNHSYSFQDQFLDGNLQFTSVRYKTNSPVILINYSTNQIAYFVPIYFYSPVTNNSDQYIGGNTVIGTNLSIGGNMSAGGNGSVTSNLVVGGNASIAGLQTNGTFTGSTTLTNADIAFVRKAVSSLANGGNAAVPVGANVFIEVSGPTASFSIDGIANGRDGKFITVLNQTGYQMTVNNESGTDPTAANRIRTLTGSNIVLTNAAVNLIYNANVSRWIVISHNP